VGNQGYVLSYLIHLAFFLLTTYGSLTGCTVLCSSSFGEKNVWSVEGARQEADQRKLGDCGKLLLGT